jgi:hypothetical protein
MSLTPLVRQSLLKQLMPLVRLGDLGALDHALRSLLAYPLTHKMTVSGAVPPGVHAIELSHASTVIAATIARSLDHGPGMLFVKNTSATGTAAHTVTLAAGTWNGTNKIITLDAPNEAILIWFDTAGNGTILENIGAVALSGT